MLWLSRRCEARIREFLRSWGVPDGAIESGLHLTVYHARRHLPGLEQFQRVRRVSIEAHARETRFMVFAPGSENPRPELEPAKRSVGIRLTKRNTAIEDIHALRHRMISLETSHVVGQRKRSTAWTSCFGARRYQPHVKLLGPGNEIDHDLTTIGQQFRDFFKTMEFGKYEIVTRPRSLDHRIRS